MRPLDPVLVRVRRAMNHDYPGWGGVSSDVTFRHQGGPHGATDPDGRHWAHDAGGVDRGRRSRVRRGRGRVPRAAGARLYRQGPRRPRQGDARAPAAARGRPGHHAAPDRGRLGGRVTAGQALPELASVPWRARTDARWLRRWERIWQAWTLLYTVPFAAAAAGMLWLDPVTAPVALVAAAHAWIIPELYAARGASVARPKGARNERAEPVAQGLLGDLLGPDERELQRATGLALERGELGVWLIGEAGALLVAPGGPRG